MKWHFKSRNFLLGSFIALPAIVNLEACTAPQNGFYDTCDGKVASLIDPQCRTAANPGTDADSDAGTDADSNAGSADVDATSVVEDPGLQPSVFPTCKGDCVPEASGQSALDWTWEPLVVWFGPKSELHKQKCNPETPYEKVRRYSNLVAPAAKCDACACEAKGTCDGLPTSIEIRDGSCAGSNVETTSFVCPAGWNGECNADNAMPAGKLCNGVPCAQSVSTSALGGPTNESCTPTVEKPNATLEKHEWLEGALACNAKDLEGTCPSTPEHCMNTVPDGWLQCLARSGKHDVCPDNYNDYGPRWTYQDNPIDDRGCSECACGAPQNGLCTATLRLFSDASCTVELNKNTMGSTGSFCVDLVPPGPALGSKTISDLSYVPGTCSVTGGVPVGAVIPNDDAKSAVTFCCRASEPLPPEPPQ